MCGLSRPCDIAAANELHPEYIGFVFAPKSRRCISPETAKHLKMQLSPQIQAVGVFVNEQPEAIARLLREGIIDIAQLHGSEDEAYLHTLRQLTDKPLIKAFRITAETELQAIAQCSADEILLDSGAGTGTVFDWKRIERIERPYFLAGGLSPDNAAAAVRQLHPYALDVSSGIETDGYKDREKMAAFVAAVRKEGNL